jgi:hypothetical protein
MSLRRAVMMRVEKGKLLVGEITASVTYDMPVLAGV